MSGPENRDDLPAELLALLEPQPKLRVKGPNRTSFRPGESGNPGGRPKELAEVRALAQAYTLDAIDCLADIITYSDDDAARRAAAVALLERAWGKPDQRVDLSGDVSIQIIRNVKGEK